MLRDQGVPENFRPFGFDQPAVLGWRPSDSELEGLEEPVLLVEGDQTPPLLRDICQLLLPHLRNGELRTLGGCDHFAPQLKPALVAEEIARFAEDSWAERFYRHGERCRTKLGSRANPPGL